MEPIFDIPVELPVHKGGNYSPVPAAIVKEWPLGTFVENLAVLSNSDFAVSVHSNNVVEILNSKGQLLRKVDLPTSPTGIVARKNGGFYVSGGEPGKPPGRLWRVESAGKPELLTEIAEALFLNGLTPLSEDKLLAVDSLLGRLYEIDLPSAAVSVWFESGDLKKITEFAFMPGANGIKRFEDSVYVTNTDRATLLRVSVKPDGSAGKAEQVVKDFRGDDFAFDEKGTGYFTTHVENSVVALPAAGVRKTIASVSEFMPGSTAIAFGREGAARKHAFVTTTGGLVRPVDRKPQTAKLIRLSLPEPGAIIPLVI